MISAIFALLIPWTAPAQDPDAAELKKRILERVREKMAAERSAILKRIERIIDEELAADPRKQKAVEDEAKERAAIEAAKAKRMADDEPVRQEAKKNGPHDEEEARELFDEALQQHEKKEFDKSVRGFKRIYYQFPKARIGFISAYNVACGYALAGKKEEALDWLEHSIKGGYNDFAHMREDTDLDSLRNEKRYKRLLADR
jgi:hypothetical protein